MRIGIAIGWLLCSLLNGALNGQDASPPEQTPAVAESNSTISPVPSTPTASATAVSKEGKDNPSKWNETLTAYGTLIGAIVGGLAAIAAAFSAYYSYRTVRQADAAELERKHSARVERLSLLWPEIQKWTYLSETDLQDLNSKHLAQTVLNNINSMSNVGYWYTRNLIDRDDLAKEIASGYVSIFEQIRDLGRMTELARTGPELIAENPNAQSLYEDFQKYLAANRVPASANAVNTTPPTRRLP